MVFISQPFFLIIFRNFAKSAIFDRPFRTNWDAIVNLMDDNIREKVHFEMAPCAEEAFLQRYLQLDPDFENELQTEFGIDMEEENVRL